MMVVRTVASPRHHRTVHPEFCADGEGGNKCTRLAYLQRMRAVKAVALVWLVPLLLASCAHTGSVDQLGAAEWARELERRDLGPATAVYPFSTTPDMEEWTEEVLRTHFGDGGLRKLRILQAALFSADFDFAYDSLLTLTAADAFASRRGNCLSFTSMFVAMARSAGIPAFLMSVRREPEVDRDGTLVVVNRHVVAGYRGASSEVHIFDFYLTTSGPYVQERAIDDLTATAMYHVNLGGDAIRRGELDEAVRHLGIATTLAPDWAPGWVNLGVAHYRQGDAEAAFADYQRALDAEPGNPSALGNLAFIYRDQGREREAEVALRAAAQQTTNPFTLIAMADVEMARGRLGTAGGYLRKARRWYSDEPEVHLALARLAERRGDQARAERHRARAAELGRRQAPKPD
jgi:Flp pilus assembly protein TadD